MSAARLEQLTPGQQIPFGGDQVATGGAEIAAAFRPGDRLDVGSGETGRAITVVDVSDKRGSAPVAEKLYTESEESRLKRAVFAENRRLVTEPTLDLHGRPTKRDRRSLAKLRGY